MKKRTEENIDKLMSQRRLNVQEQVTLRKERILSEAKYWRSKGLPSPIEDFLRKNGIETNKSILLDYEQNNPGGSSDEGIVLTSQGLFYEFDIELNSDRTELIEVYSFKEVSDRFEIDEHKKGIGKTYGFLATEVLRELNKK